MEYTYRSFRVPLAQFGLGVIGTVSCLAWLIGFGLCGEFVAEGAVVLCCCVLVSPPFNTRPTILHWALTRIDVVVAPVLALFVPLSLVDHGARLVALVTGFVEGAFADVGEA